MQIKYNNKLLDHIESIEQPKEVEISRQGKASSDYRRWRQRAIEDVKESRPQRGFTTTLIPERIHKEISIGLGRCQSVEDVKNIFRLVQSVEIEA